MVVLMGCCSWSGGRRTDCLRCGWDEIWWFWWWTRRCMWGYNGGEEVVSITEDLIEAAAGDGIVEFELRGLLLVWVSCSWSNCRRCDVVIQWLCWFKNLDICLGKLGTALVLLVVVWIAGDSWGLKRTSVGAATDGNEWWLCMRWLQLNWSSSYDMARVMKLRLMAKREFRDQEERMVKFVLKRWNSGRGVLNSNNEKTNLCWSFDLRFWKGHNIVLWTWEQGEVQMGL